MCRASWIWSVVDISFVTDARSDTQSDLCTDSCSAAKESRFLNFELWAKGRIGILQRLPNKLQIVARISVKTMIISWKNTVAALDVPIWPNARQPEWLLQQAQNHQPTVVLASSLTSRVLDHFGDAQVEKGGLLLGRLWRDESSKPGTVDLVEICQEVPALAADSSALSLKMDTLVWEAARLICVQTNDQSTSPLRVVGWYHSHPNLGAFFSQTDRQTQANFFSNTFSIGWVIDPFNTHRDGSLDEAFFIGALSSPTNAFRLM